MGRIRTICAAWLALAATSAPAPAEDGMMRTFAACAGRLSAQLEHE
jgi:hypothetical protein